MVPTLREGDTEGGGGGGGEGTVITQRATSVSNKKKKKHNPNTNAHDVNGPTKAVVAGGHGGGMTVQLELPAAIKMRHGKIYNLI